MVENEHINKALIYWIVCSLNHFCTVGDYLCCIEIRPIENFTSQAFGGPTEGGGIDVIFNFYIYIYIY